MAIARWFEALAPREKLLVALAGALACIALLTVGVLRPISASQRRLSEQLTDKQSVLGDIERVAARFGTVSAGTVSADRSNGESLVVLIDRTLRGRGLGGYLKRNEPDGPASIRLRFENVPFDDLVGWLVEMQAGHGVGVTSLSADPAAAAGRVNASLQLARTGAG